MTFTSDHQYIKEYKVGHCARNRDHFARAVFVLMGVGKGMDDCWSIILSILPRFTFCQSGVLWSTWIGSTVNISRWSTIVNPGGTPENYSAHYLRAKHRVTTSNIKNQSIKIIVTSVFHAQVFPLMEFLLY